MLDDSIEGKEWADDWARFVRLIVKVREGLVGEKVQMSSGVSRGNMSWSQSVEVGLVWGGGWDVICDLVFGPDREGRAALDMCVCVLTRRVVMGKQGQRFPKWDEDIAAVKVPVKPQQVMYSMDEKCFKISEWICFLFPLSRTWR